MKKELKNIFVFVLLLLAPILMFSQTLQLGTLSDFESFAGTGAITGPGATGDAIGHVGTNAGIISGFNLSYTGTQHNNNSVSIQARIDLLKVYISLSDIFVTQPGTHAAAFGSGETIAPGVYSIGSAGSIAGSLTLDGGGDTNAIFIMKFEGALTAAASSTLILTGKTRSDNIYWIAEGAISIGANSAIKGNLFAHPGAVTLGAGCDIEGRLLTTAGAITFGAGTEAITPRDPTSIPIQFSSDRPPATAVDVLGSIEGFAMFSSFGAVSNAATSGFIGHIGTNAGIISGYATSPQVGEVYNVDAITAQAKIDLDSAYTKLVAISKTDSTHTAAFGSGETLSAGIYYIAAAGSLAGTVTLDAGGDSDAIFIFRFNGAFSVASQSKVILINGARICNVFWIAEGALSMGTFTYMKGTVISHNYACSMAANGNLEGRMLSTAGAVSFSTGVIYTIKSSVDPYLDFTKDQTAGLNLDSGNTWSASWADYDNDGYDDLFVPTNDLNKPNLLYHNNGDGTFSKITTGSIVTDLGSSIAGAWGDYDNDGYIDLFVANNVNSANSLYHNNGNGTFTSITNTALVKEGIYTHAAAWADYNRDGNLDLVLSDFHLTNYNFIFLGDGTGGFTEDATSEVALSATSAVGISWGDYDNDGDPDLFIANTNGENNQLFTNEGGTLKTVTTGSIVTDGGTSVGGAWGDYDNDGDLDLFVTNTSITEANFFYENDGDGTFTKITSGELVTNTSTSNGASWVDFDNDGYIDLLVANDQGQSDFLFKNNGNQTFTKLDNAITQETSNSFGTSWADFDNDGDYDLIVANIGENTNDFFINGKGSYKSYLSIKLTGCNSNKSAIGAMIKVKSTINGVALWQTKDIATQNSALGGQSSQKILFGLGNATTIDSVSVYWPSGIITHTTNATINTVLTITEPCGSKVTGIVYHDVNSDGAQSATELGIPNRSLTVTPGNHQVFTSTDGNYEFFLVDGTYSLSLSGTSSWSQTSPTSPGSISLTINQVTQSIYGGNDFGNSANCSSPDFTVALGNTAMRRGLLSDLNVKITNEGAYSASSSVSVKLTMSDDMYLTATNYTSISTANNLRTYVFGLGTISALSDSILTLTDSIDVNATLNDTIEVSATVIYGGSECNTLNNTASFTDIIVGSIDPNDKQVFVNDNNTKHKTKDTYPELLTYKIRFQNLGNYAARRVQIVDTLSPLLDWSSFNISGSSHDFSVSIIDGVATWINENIELPCIEDNEEESNGFVTFTIIPKTNAAPYTLVHNVGYIQFDRNEYIATNDASAVIGLGNVAIDETELIVYPNPVHESTSILLIDKNQRPIEISSIHVLSLSGKIETKITPSSYKTTLYITDLASGLYTLRITTHDGKAYYKKIVKI